MANDGKAKLENYFTHAKPTRYKKGETIIRGTEQETWLYFVSQGYVQVYEFGSSGQHNIHFIYKRGEVFPLLWLADTPDQELHYEAMTDVVAYKRSRADFLQSIEGDLDLRLEVWNRLNRKFNLFYNRVRNLQLPTAYERLTYRLLELGKRFGEQTEQGMAIELPVTHQDIANSINVSRETVSREFEKLKRQGLLTYSSHPRQLVIKDIQELESKLDNNAVIL